MSRHVAPHRLAGALDARQQRHVDGCARCQATLARVQAARVALTDAARSEPAELSPAAEARCEASIRWTRVPAMAAVRRPFLVGLGVAAATAAAVFVWNVREPRRNAYAMTEPSPPRHHAPAPALPDRLEALVTLIGGDVQVARADAPSRRLSLDTRLGAADRIITGANARAAAQWSEGSGFLLSGNSVLNLARLEPRTQRLELERGQIAVRVGPHEPGESLHVITPDHVVSVHGTWFTVASSEHVTTVEVLEGTVEVTNRDGSSSTMLTAPARAVFGRGRTASAPLSGRQAARLRAESEMNFQPWPGLEAARAASGALLVASQPPAELAVDGIVLGGTPLDVRRPLGNHYVELTRADFRTMQKWIAVGREPSELHAALVKAPPAPDPDSAPIEIESMVHRRASQIRACYERRLKHDPQLAGTVSLRLRVGDAGQVTRVDVEQSTLPDPLVADCLRHEAAGWSFTQGRNATVVYPFVFRTQ